jgi:UDP-GlcNAc:undecaprenyl-phosphate GlcNAc-1-phosphate transferase
MSELLAVTTALAVSIAIIPMMMRLAPRLGMLDMPDARKVHARPVPRVGGLGIALGALAAILLLAPQAGWLYTYVAGALVLLVSGALDDSREMGHYAKFAGQVLAVAPMVWFGGVWVSSVPFLDAPLPPEIGKPFTVFAIVGVINAVNHSDGLDGLAAGESLLSLAAIAYLAHLAGDTVLVLMCFALLGGLFGFLRFNTHPARVFMGDAGSQFLGFSLGAFVVVLTQQSNPGLSMALPLLILGLPVIDILAVLYQRVRGGMNWFRATRNHIHHRLLALGLDHYQAVVAIYAVQTLFVVAAIVFRHDSDALVLALYLAPCAALFAALTLAERGGWRLARGAGESRIARLLGGERASGIAVALTAGISLAIPAYFVAGGFAVRTLPAGIGPGLAAIAAVLAAAAMFPRRAWLSLPARLCLYGLAPLWVYGVERQLQALAPVALASTVPFYAALALAIGLVWKLARDRDFAPTTMDFLIAVVALGATLLAGSLAQSAQVAALLIKIVLLLYGCELIETRAGAAARRGLRAAGAASAALALARLAG